MKPGRTLLPLTSMTSAPAGIETSSRSPTAWNLPAWITMTEFSTGGRPVPSISFPPCTTTVFSAIYSFLPRFAWHQHQAVLRFDFHLPRENLFVGPSAPGDIARRAVEIRKIIERDERHILHENFSCLLEQRNPLLGVPGFLLLFDQLIECRVAVVHSLRGA